MARKTRTPRPGSVATVRCPGIAEVPVPPAPVPPGRDYELALTSDKTGVRIKVGAAWAVTLFPRHLRQIGPMLGMDYAKMVNERNEARADHEKADRTLQGILNELDIAQRQVESLRDAAARKDEQITKLVADVKKAEAEAQKWEEAHAALLKANEALDQKLALHLHQRRAGILIALVVLVTTIVGTLGLAGVFGRPGR